MGYDTIYRIVLKILRNRRPYDTDDILAEEITNEVLEILEDEEGLEDFDDET